MEYITHSPEETETLGERLAQRLEPWGQERRPSPGAWPGGWGSPTG